MGAPGRSGVARQAGGGVNLAAGGDADREAAPGQSFTGPIRVSNVGDTVANGAAILFFNDLAIRAAEKFSNCTYVEDRPRACQFNIDLRPGSTYGAAFPYVLGEDSYAPGSAAGEHLWMTPAELEDYLDHLARFGVAAGAPGNGGVLELEQMSSLGGQALQADVEPTDNWALLRVTVTGTNGTDLAAIGDTLTGAAGDVVTASAGLTNKGPATLDHGRSGSGITVVHVAVPPGTTAVPRQCLPETDDGIDGEHRGMPGAPKYACDTDFLIVAGDTEMIDFKLRIDKVIADATGTVSILEPCQCEGFPPELDLDNSNNRAKIVVNATSSGGGGLANTGARIGPIVAVSVLLLVTGLLAVTFARRRRVRSVP